MFKTYENRRQSYKPRAVFLYYFLPFGLFFRVRFIRHVDRVYPAPIRFVFVSSRLRVDIPSRDAHPSRAKFRWTSAIKILSYRTVLWYFVPGVSRHFVRPDPRNRFENDKIKPGTSIFGRLKPVPRPRVVIFAARNSITKLSIRQRDGRASVNIRFIMQLTTKTIQLLYRECRELTILTIIQPRE